MIDDTERAVVTQGNQLLKSILENHINERIKQEEFSHQKRCPDGKIEEEKVRNRGGKKNAPHLNRRNKAQTIVL